MYKTILVEKKEEVIKITLNRPDKMNAMNMEMYNDLMSVLDDVEEDDTVKVIIFTGAGRAFCAGGDLDYFLATKDSAEFYEFNDAAERIFNRLQHSKKIVIAAVNGYCLAGGFELISACDVVIASENATLGDEHINRGLIPGGFSVYRWGRILGPRKVFEVLFTGKRYSAKEAEVVGIINKAVPANKLDEAATEMANIFASKSGKALEIGKHNVSRAFDVDLSTHSDLSILSFMVNFAHLVGSGGVKDFVQKRDK